MQMRLRTGPPAPTAAWQDCETLRRLSDKSCGQTFTCTPECKENFAKYHGRCLANAEPDAHKRLFDRFESYFRRCEVCTTEHFTNVKASCAFCIPVASSLTPDAACLRSGYPHRLQRGDQGPAAYVQHALRGDVPAVLHGVPGT